MRLVDDKWTAEPVNRTQAVSDDKSLSDKHAAMFDAIKATLARHGFIQRTEEDGKEHFSAARQTVRDHLIAASWFTEEQLFTAFEDGRERQKPTKAALTIENNALTALKRKKIIDFNRALVWRP